MEFDLRDVRKKNIKKKYIKKYIKNIKYFV